MDAGELTQRLMSAVVAMRGTKLSVGGVTENCETVREVAALLDAPVSSQVCIYDSGPLVIEALAVRIEGVDVRLQASRPATEADLDKPWSRYSTSPEVPEPERAEALRRAHRAFLAEHGAEVGRG
jgi:hypothetical protein